MLDMSWGELLVIGGVALVVIGPKDLPKALRTVGNVVGKVRRMAGEFQTQFNDAMREADLDELRKSASDISDAIKPFKSEFDPLKSARDELKKAVEGPVAEASDASKNQIKSIAENAVEPPVISKTDTAGASKPRRAARAKKGVSSTEPVAIERPKLAKAAVKKTAPASAASKTVKTKTPAKPVISKELASAEAPLKKAASKKAVPQKSATKRTPARKPASRSDEKA